MADDVDVAVEYEEHLMDETFNKIRKKREEEKEALTHIEERECEECGKTIPLARLYIVPLTRLCVSCQSNLEHH